MAEYQLLFVGVYILCAFPCVNYVSYMLVHVPECGWCAIEEEGELC